MGMSLAITHLYARFDIIGTQFKLLKNKELAKRKLQLSMDDVLIAGSEPPKRFEEIGKCASV